MRRRLGGCLIEAGPCAATKCRPTRPATAKSRQLNGVHADVCNRGQGPSGKGASGEARSGSDPAMAMMRGGWPVAVRKRRRCNSHTGSPEQTLVGWPMLSRLGWECGLRYFLPMRRWLLSYWPRFWSLALIMALVICCKEGERIVAAWQTKPSQLGHCS